MIATKHDLEIIDMEGDPFTISSEHGIVLVFRCHPDEAMLNKDSVKILAYRLLHWCNTGSLKLPTDKEP